MELEPMYCAEQVLNSVDRLCWACTIALAFDLLPTVSQIKVPPNLADVLKAYTKEVIRQQPADILQFSAK